MTKGQSPVGAEQGDLFYDADRFDPRPVRSKSKPKKVAQPEGLPKLSSVAQFLSIDQVAQRYGVGKSTIWRWVAKDDNFPEPVKLSKGTSRWYESQLLDFERRVFRRTSTKMSNAKKRKLRTLAKGRPS